MAIIFTIITDESTNCYQMSKIKKVADDIYKLSTIMTKVQESKVFCFLPEGKSVLYLLLQMKFLNILNDIWGIVPYFHW